MFKLIKRAWRYMTAALTGKFEEVADPKVQLEQAINDAQEQHRRLREQAANVIANQKQTEMQLNRAAAEMDKLNASTRQALVMANDATQRGDVGKATDYNQAAEGFANRLIAVEKQVQDLKTMHLQTAQAADQAKAAVTQNSTALQQKLAERQKLMSQLDQAKMQEQLNRAMSTLSETVGRDTPSLEEVRSKIETRYARALGSSELQDQTVEARMLEVEQATMGSEAQSRLSAMRSQLGLGTGSGPSSTEQALDTETPEVIDEGNPAGAGKPESSSSGA